MMSPTLVTFGLAVPDEEAVLWGQCRKAYWHSSLLSQDVFDFADSETGISDLLIFPDTLPQSLNSPALNQTTRGQRNEENHSILVISICFC